ncbi:hypothetical protein [Caldivirga maquilingensis]|uniref:Uncharacterized protein n=1 Tax=Caldivirga maquilingensis (strain ATCC 700844 / DSM 13496 / JCM 10307 / IC-167) TaxID=397948 RepID=A8MBA7_CALMQ|nr:hypothetical protein [Caldivirga maquilingensis]ABW01197.1 hypothetical protein Cmaq_0351 [Caldivirga maquilingensis IC-167]
MRRGLRLDSINARKIRGPDGFFTVAMGIEVFRLIEDKVRELGLISEVLGDVVLVKAKSWSSISRLLQYARSRGINVIED